MQDIIKQESLDFIIPSNKINASAVEKVNKFLPELEEKTKAFGSRNSQSTLTLMSLTMLCGHSPYRMLRQILAEVEKRKMALSEAQVSYAKSIQAIEKLEGETDPVLAARYRAKCISLSLMENKINGSFKDIATLINAYNNIKATHNISEWDEVAFEEEEKRHHVKRAFELMYRNLLDSGRVSPSTTEYMQQFGLHPQLCLAEVSGYMAYINGLIKKGEAENLHANHLEDFLSEMSYKYQSNPDITSERIYGTSDFIDRDLMYRSVEAK